MRSRTILPATPAFFLFPFLGSSPATYNGGQVDGPPSSPPPSLTNGPLEGTSPVRRYPIIEHLQANCFFPS